MLKGRGRAESVSTDDNVERFAELIASQRTHKEPVFRNGKLLKDFIISCHVVVLEIILREI